jgi:hypothetical protein
MPIKQILVDDPAPNGKPKRRFAAFALIPAIFFSAVPLSAADQRVIAPWTGLGKNALSAYTGSNAIFHLSALAGTFLIVQTGLDTQVHNFFARNRFMDSTSHPAVSVGAYFPAILGAGVLASGLVGGGSRLATAGSAVLQASLLSAGAMLTLKALTGRPGPDPVVYEDNSASRVWRFGFLRGGVFHGWPSGHMMTNVAAITSLMAFYKDKTLLNVAGSVSIGYLFLSVLSHGRSAMHWFSDAVAGTLMGVAIGTTVGREFRRRFDHEAETTSSLAARVIPGRFAITICLDI